MYDAAWRRGSRAIGKRLRADLSVRHSGRGRSLGGGAGAETFGHESGCPVLHSLSWKNTIAEDLRWIPACAGMTGKALAMGRPSPRQKASPVLNTKYGPIRGRSPRRGTGVESCGHVTGCPVLHSLSWKNTIAEDLRWIPACAGMTGKALAMGRPSPRQKASPVLNTKYGPIRGRSPRRGTGVESCGHVTGCPVLHSLSWKNTIAEDLRWIPACAGMTAQLRGLPRRPQANETKPKGYTKCGPFAGQIAVSWLADRLLSTGKD